jgi:hypothetical protein
VDIRNTGSLSGPPDALSENQKQNRHTALMIALDDVFSNMYNVVVFLNFLPDANPFFSVISSVKYFERCKIIHTQTHFFIPSIIIFL